YSVMRGANFSPLTQLPRLFLGGILLMGLGTLPGIKRIRAHREVRLSLGGIAAGVIVLDLCLIILLRTLGASASEVSYWENTWIVQAPAGAVAGITLLTLFRRELGLFSWKVVFINSLLWALGNFVGVSLRVDAAYGFFIGAASGWTILWTVSKKSERQL